LYVLSKVFVEIFICWFLKSFFRIFIIIDKNVPGHFYV